MEANGKGATNWELFWAFAKMGGMTFGGGMAMLPILQREVVERRHWATEQELTDYFAIGQCTPGIIAVNTATFIGQKFGGFIGGTMATPIGRCSSSIWSCVKPSCSRRARTKAVLRREPRQPR